jgi:hypothetical protein
MIDQLFSTKVKITETNIIFVEYCKQWVNTLCFSLKMKEEYDYAYNKFRKFMESDRAEKEVGYHREQISDSYIQSSFLPKEHRLVWYMMNAVRDFYSCTSYQAENEGRSIKMPGVTKPQHNIHQSTVAMAMANMAEHRYQVNESISGRAIVAHSFGVDRLLLSPWQ